MSPMRDFVQRSRPAGTAGRFAIYGLIAGIILIGKA
jgi:hypothetical protein